MTPFELAINDIFNTPDFLDVCVFRQTSLRCIVSAVSEDGVFGQFGFEDGISFALDLLCSSLDSKPRKNELITFRGVEYRVDSAVLDSAGTTWKIYLKSKNSP